MNEHSSLQKTLNRILSRPLLTVLLLLIASVVQSEVVQSEIIETQHCVVDMSDRSVCLSTRTPKIISLSPGSTELLFAAGAGDRVIAVDQHSDYPEAVKQLPNVGGYPNVNVEALVAMEPDLVVVWTAGNSQKVIRQLEAIGIKTFHVDVVDFSGIEQVIRKLGDVAGTEKKASVTADQFVHRLNALKKQYEQREPVSVFFEIWRAPLMTVGRDQVIHSAISLCGGRNVFGDVSEKIPRIGIESLISRDPQVIIDSDPRGDTPESRQEMMDYWSQWRNLQAVKKQQLFSVPSDLIARPTPRMLDGAEMICQQLQTVRSARGHTELVAGKIN